MAMRDAIAIKGARENNLRNIDVSIPRDKLVVITGISGSGKSSLAFDTVYAEGQRRFMESMSTYAKRFVEQMKKPDVDFVTGLSPVISIEQKTIFNNPRSTVGTMTDLYEYLRMLYSTVGQAHCPYCRRPIAYRTPYQMAEHLLSLPAGAEVEIRAPVFKIYGIVVEHDEETIRSADHIIELGPGPGVHGGRIAAEGTIRQILKNPNSLTGQFLTGRQHISVPDERRPLNGHSLRVLGARANNLDDLDVKIPLGVFVCVSGASGSGKSSLVHDILYKKLYSIFHDSRVLSGAHDRLDGVEHISDVINIDQSPIGRSPRSNPATYIGFYDNIRRLFAQTPEAKKRGYTASRFSFNVKGGRCEECGGEGTVTTKLHLMADVEVPCPTCKGARYNQDTLEVTYQGKNIAEVLAMTIEDGVDFFADQRLIAHKLGVLNDLGLGYLQIGHPAPLLSGGEAQRVKLADELGKLKRGKSNLYLLDEPTTGLHLADIQRLLDSLNRLVEAGHTVLVIEHHLDVIKTADYIIDLGPEGGHNGGQIVGQGTPEELAEVSESYTGQFLKNYLV